MHSQQRADQIRSNIISSNLSQRIKDYLLRQLQKDSDKVNKRKEVQSQLRFFLDNQGDPDEGAALMRRYSFINQKKLTYAVLGQILIKLGQMKKIPPTGRNVKTKFNIHAYIASHPRELIPIIDTIEIYDKGSSQSQSQIIANKILDSLNEGITQSSLYQSVVHLQDHNGEDLYFAICPNKKAVRAFNSAGAVISTLEEPQSPLDTTMTQQVFGLQKMEEIFSFNREDMQTNLTETFRTFINPIFSSDQEECPDWIL